MTTRQWLGIYMGRVTKNRAADLCVQLQVPQVLGTAVTDWAQPLGYQNNGSTSGAGPGPATGTLVQVMFIGGDVRTPVYHLYAQANDTSGAEALGTLTSQAGTTTEIGTMGTGIWWAANTTTPLGGTTGYTVAGGTNHTHPLGDTTHSHDVNYNNALSTQINAVINQLNEITTKLEAAGIL